MKTTAKMKKKTPEGHPVMTVRIPAALRDALAQMSAETELPVSAIFRRGVRAELERYKASGEVY